MGSDRYGWVGAHSNQEWTERTSLIVLALFFVPTTVVLGVIERVIDQGCGTCVCRSFVIPTICSKTTEKNHETCIYGGARVVHMLFDLLYRHRFASNIVANEIPIVKWAVGIEITLCKETVASIYPFGRV
jgi:hypothetical protein